VFTIDANDTVTLDNVTKTKSHEQQFPFQLVKTHPTQPKSLGIHLILARRRGSAHGEKPLSPPFFAVHDIAADANILILLPLSGHCGRREIFGA
jgi:hypothetical protein